MRPSIRLGRIFGIDIGLHYSWFVIALLILFSLSGHFRVVNPEWSLGLTWALAAITALFFFASILAHELSHAAVAKARGLPVKSITLFALGGVANIEKESQDAKSEFWMAIVGPITSLVIGLVFIGIVQAAGWDPESGTPPSPLWAGFAWLGYINIALAVFNMIPGYPLDGGRVLRSIIWAINRDMVRATKITASVGRVVAVAFIVGGLFRFFYAGAFGGLWLAFIGWFLSQAAESSRANAQVSTTLAGVPVSDVMSQACAIVDGNINLRTFAEDHLMRTGRRCFVVAENGRQAGLVTIDELKRVGREQWPFKTVGDIVLPFEQMPTVSPETSLVDAMQLMMQRNVNLLPVLSNGRLNGVVTRNDVVQFIETRQELKAA
jgi:Zn-dependent protease/predicted transcriptional regulator